MLDASAAQALAARRTTLDLVTEALRAAILHGRVHPGQLLRQDEVARQFGVSRQPVRQAIRILHHEGLVDLAPHGAARVSNLSLADVEESFGIRAILEAEAVKLSVPRLTDEDLRKLQSLYRSMSDADRTSDEWVQLNATFHETVYGACGWPHLIELIRLERNRVQRYMSIALRLAGRDPREEHTQILGACERRDADLVSHLVSKHILRTAQCVSTYISQASNDQTAPETRHSDVCRV